MHDSSRNTSLSIRYLAWKSRYQWQNNENIKIFVFFAGLFNSFGYCDSNQVFNDILFFNRRDEELILYVNESFGFLNELNVSLEYWIFCWRWATESYRPFARRSQNLTWECLLEICCFKRHFLLNCKCLGFLQSFPCRRYISKSVFGAWFLLIWLYFTQQI